MDLGEFIIYDDYNQNVITTSKNAPLEARSPITTPVASTESLGATDAFKDATSTPISDARKTDTEKIDLCSESSLSIADRKVR